MNPFAWLGIAAAAGFLAGGVSLMIPRGGAQAAAPVMAPRATPQPVARSGDRVTACYAVDGDTLRCGSERIRLIGIDSPEMPGHCQEGRVCVEGDPVAAQAALGGSVSASMAIRRFGTDHYGRTLALVEGPLGDLSCSQLRSGHAIYRADWDNEGALRAICAV